MESCASNQFVPGGKSLNYSSTRLYQRGYPQIRAGRFWNDPDSEKAGLENSFPKKIHVNLPRKTFFRTKFRGIWSGKVLSKQNPGELCSDNSFPYSISPNEGQKTLQWTSFLAKSWMEQFLAEPFPSALRSTGDPPTEWIPSVGAHPPSGVVFRALAENTGDVTRPIGLPKIRSSRHVFPRRGGCVHPIMSHSCTPEPLYSNRRWTERTERKSASQNGARTF